jgi:hypothetical protein
MVSTSGLTSLAKEKRLVAVRLEAHTRSSQLTLLDKPGSYTPRPIRAGNYLRRVVGKRLLLDFAPRIRRLMLKFLQFGVAMPCGCETVIRWQVLGSLILPGWC